MISARRTIGGSLLAAGIATAGVLGMKATGASPGQEKTCWAGQTPGFLTTCGTYTVPENHAQRNGPQVVMSYVRMRRAGADKSKAPVFFIDGGPGTGTVGPTDFSPSYWTNWVNGLATDRDVILFDQRGMGSSKPSLNCPELDDPVVRVGLSRDPKTFPPWASLSDAALKACRARLLADGVDLDQYNSANIIRDIEHLRKQLGHAKIVPYGVSNGTRLALKYVRDHSDVVEAMVLDSVAPPDVAVSQEYLFSFAEALEKIGALCRSQTVCAVAHPDISATLAKALQRLATNPVVIEIENRTGRDKLYMQVTDTVLLEILFDITYGNAAYSNVVQFIADMAQGRDRNLTAYATTMIYDGLYSNTLYEAAYWSIECSDEYDPATTAAYIKRLDQHPLLRRWASEYWTKVPCSFWPTPLAAKRERSPVKSNVPALLIGDQFDPVTPPSGAHHAAKTLANAQVVTLPVGGHTVTFTNDCAKVIVQQFLANPEARVDTMCVRAVRSPIFHVSPASLVENSE